MHPEIVRIQTMLGGEGYVADREIATAIYLSMSLRKPLLIEGAAGVGKTEVAKVMARALGADLIRLQCGFCTPGMMLTALQILQRNPDANEREIRHGLEGNLCRCTGYQQIVSAVRYAARKMAGSSPD